MKSFTFLLVAASSFLSFATASPVPSDSTRSTAQRRDNVGVSIGLGGGSKGKSGPLTLPDALLVLTSTYTVTATPDQVINNNQTAVPGLAGAKGVYRFGINSHHDVICYNITLYGFSGSYSSPARTATHIHQAVKGRAGPPRLAFPNPEGTGSTRNSVGCMKGPFTTGLVTNGTDTGSGFSLKQIEENPKGFFADVHTSDFLAGAIRGQLS